MSSERAHLIGAASTGHTVAGLDDQGLTPGQNGLGRQTVSVTGGSEQKDYTQIPGRVSPPQNEISLLECQVSADDALPLETEDNLQEKGRITSIQAFIHIVRCHAGSGLLGAAKAVNNTGFWVGLVLFPLSGVMVLTGMHMIVGCSRRLGTRLAIDTATWTYQEIVEKSFLHGSVPFRRFSKVARSCAVVFSALLQFGVCAFFFVVVGDGVHQLFAEFWGVDVNVRLVMLAMLLLLVPPSLIKRLDILAIFSAIANVLFGACILIALGYLVVDLPPVSTRPGFNSWATLPMFFGQALQAMEGIAVVVPVQNKMKRPERFASWFGVLNVGLGFVIVLITLIGTLGYLKYGTETATNILLNLPSDQWLSVAAKVMLPVSLLLTYPIQFYFIFVMIWPPLEARLSSPWMLENGEYIQRLVTLLLTCGCAAFVPHLDLLMALWGSMCCTFLGFIIPAACDLTLHSIPGHRIGFFAGCRDIFFIFVGLFAFVSGIFFALKDIVATFR